MTQRCGSVVAILFLGLFGCQGTQADKSSLNDLSLEVAALHAVYQFQLTPDQMRTLHKLARETAGEASGSRETPKASAAFRKALTSLRDALVKADDDDLIGKLVEAMESLREKEDPQLDDGIEITDAARQRTPEVLKTLSTRQVMTYLTSLGDEVADPSETLLEALDEVRGLKEEEWKQLRQSVGRHVGSLVAGLDEDRANRISDRVVQWLIRIRALKDDEFKDERAELEAEARKIIGNVGPTDVLRHYVEHALAELLSNPRLEAALAARLK